MEGEGLGLLLYLNLLKVIITLTVGLHQQIELVPEKACCVLVYKRIS